MFIKEKSQGDHRNLIEQNTIRNWSKSIAGGGGRGKAGGGAFGNVVDKKHIAYPPPFGTKMTDPPLKKGWKMHDPPQVKTWMFGFLLIIQ